MKKATCSEDCADCLCRVCARNTYIDAFNKIAEEDGEWCEGCNACNKWVIETQEDCPRKLFLPDEGIERS